MKYYQESGAAVLQALQSTQNGLSGTEADRRRAQDGPNRLEEAQRRSPFRRFLCQFADPMVAVLLCAAGVSALVSHYEGEPFADSIIILTVVLLNALLGVIQESKAERAIAALKKMTAPSSHVLRDGKWTMIPSEQLVRGDIIRLESGDAVPADARVLESASLRCEESSLTGESLPVEKQTQPLSREAGDVPLGDRSNMLYMGSAVVYGRGSAVVTDIGMQSEMGRIAHVLSHAGQGETPLQKRLSSLSRTLTLLILGICVFIFLFTLVKSGDYSIDGILDTFMLAVSLAVAAIPEGLSAVVTIVLSIGVTKMSRRSAIIRRLTAVETLGCTQIICSDKTGTLTQNRMEVCERTGDADRMDEISVLCSDAEPLADGSFSGEPTECALLAFCAHSKTDIAALRKSAPRLAELPFDSARKRMSVFCRCAGSVVQYTKGAPDVLLPLCSARLEHGRIVPMTDADRQRIAGDNSRMAGQALRVIAGAMRIYPRLPAPLSPDAQERELVFVGLAGMRDPIRPEVRDAVAQCRRAGIRPVMITGDHLDTAAAVASQLGLLHRRDEAITGAELDALDDDALCAAVTQYSVYARVKPEHKVRIVNAWKRRGFVTAMTGDGVNDAPALKSADIGIGMGKSGTDVAKNVADMILSDDNFATIVSAVREGRRIYDNICKAIQFLLSSNLSEVLSIFGATVMGFVILKPLHILWINLITDSLPALALGMEPEEPDIMRCKPRGSESSLFADRTGNAILFQGVAVSLLTLAAYFAGYYAEHGCIAFGQSADGITMAFLTMSMAEIFHSLNMRSRTLSLFALPTLNVCLIGAMLLSLVLTSAVIYVEPLRVLFGLEWINIYEYFISLGLAFFIIPVVEWEKALRRRRKKK